MSALPVLIANAVEEAFPTPADASTGLLFTSSIFVQMFTTPSLQCMLDVATVPCGGLASPPKLFISGLAFFGCLVPALLYRGENRRALAEMQHERATSFAM